MATERISQCFFATYTSDEILKLSVKEIRNPNTFDALLHATPGGLYDSALGPHEKDDVCGTCGLGSLKCPGHFGHISLPLPVYHPLFFRVLVKILKGSCFKCHRLVIPKSRLQLVKRQLDLLDKSLITGAMDLEDLYNATLHEKARNTATMATFEIEVSRVIDEEFQKALESGSDIGFCSKNATRLKHVIVKNFFLLVSHGKKYKDCPSCSAPIHDVRAEYNARLYLKPVSRKQAKKAMQKKMGKNNDEEQDQDDMDNTLETEASREMEDDNVSKDIDKLLKQQYLTPVDVRDHVHKLWDSDKELMNAVFGSICSQTRTRNGSPDMFFVHVVPVAPSRFRPVSSLGERRFENPQTVNLNKILVDCALLNHYLIQIQNKDKDEGVKIVEPLFRKKRSGIVSVAGETNEEKIQNAWLQLQSHVNIYMDSDLDKLSMDKMPGIRQILEKKEGLFRKHMMGKRVNFAARSVISPDPYINTDEIGIPEIFAKKLTYPQPVTPWNSEVLMQAIINGPKVHPGAVLVEYEDGTGVALNPNNLQQRKAIARRLLTPKLEAEMTLGCKKVHRHLINGDVLLLNRQPTLHRPSIMAHKARVLPKEKTIRLHYANCKAYNADFDGDEMNAHFPQNELARAESYGLVSTNFQYLSPRDGKPLSGLIQDHVVSGVQMTTRNVFFSREEYQQLVYDALIDKNGKISTLHPSVLKPKVLWSGKQVVSTVMINIIPEGKELLNLHSKGKVSDKNWPKNKNESPLSSTSITDRYLNESEVIIRQSELLTGILDKSQYGATPFGLVHSCFELYGGEVSGKLLSVLARLFTSFLRVRGFSLGVEDILVKTKAEQRRDKYIQLGRTCGDEAAVAGLGLESTATKDEVQCKLREAHHTEKGFGLQLLDRAVKQKTDFYQNKINTSVIPNGLLKSFPDNALQLMIESGAKGSAVNAMQISSLLGQIELEGRRPPLMMSGRSLPSFLPYDTSARAGGFVDGRFLTGIRPQEYFFHCMAGREGLVDTAVKTSRSGYLQRCLIKHLEGLVVQYDLTVRDGDGSVMQFLYGEDGIDVCKSPFLRQDRFGFIADNFEEYNDQLTPDDSLEKINDVVASKRQNKIKRWRKKFGEPFSSPINHQYQSPFRQFISESYTQRGNHLVKDELVKQWHKLPHHDKESIAYQCRPCLDPVLSTLSPDRYFASVSEKYNDSVESFIARNPTGVLSEKDGHQTRKIPKKSFHPLLLLKYLRSLASPGDAVGLLASQSIGEPSTQMTLNTFHFAGRGEMNVTLGIPRLREILMTASPNIKTPTMDVLVRNGEEAFKGAKSLQRKLNRVRISDVLRKIDVSELIVVNRKKGSNMTFLAPYCSLTLEETNIATTTFGWSSYPHSVYKEDFSIKSEDILLYVESVFIRKIVTAVLKIMKIRKDATVLHSKEDETQRNTARTSAPESQEDIPDESDAEVDLSDGDENVDGDAADAKSRARQTQFTSYEEPEEEEVVLDNEQEDDEMELKEETLDEKVQEDTLEELSNDVILTVSDSSLEKETRVNSVLASDSVIVRYDFDERKKRWCEFTLQLPIVGSKVMLIPVIEQVAERAVVSEAKGITKALLAPSQNPKEEGRHRIRTEGVNVEELWRHQNILDVNALYTNSIHALAERYGIEAARRGIIKEIHDVFKVYGIYVDPRHLSLIGDYMTFEGTYRPFNRVGIETNPSPFQKMSFETTMHFLRDATAFGDVDSLGSPSSCLVVGKAVKVGTGIFQLQQPLC